jgi:hypothetical protein
MFTVFATIMLVLILAGVIVGLSALAGLAAWSRTLQESLATLQTTLEYESGQRVEDADKNNTLHSVTRQYIGGLIRDRIFPALNIPKDRPKSAFERKVMSDWLSS